MQTMLLLKASFTHLGRCTAHASAGMWHTNVTVLSQLRRCSVPRRKFAVLTVACILTIICLQLPVVVFICVQCHQCGKFVTLEC